jgi:cell division septum initiation protein DivIVA
MAIEDLHRQAEWLRSAEPDKALRGFDEEQTRKVFDDAARLLKAAAHELDASQRELQNLRAAASEDAASKETIGSALLAATRAGEELVAEAHSSAETIRAEAEEQAAALVERAKTDAAKREANLERARAEFEHERTEFAREAGSTRAAFERENADARAALAEETAAARAKLEQEMTAVSAALTAETETLRAELEGERERLRADQDAWQGAIAEERRLLRADVDAQADVILAEARAEAERLERYGEELRATLAWERRRFVDVARSALEQLDAIERERDGVPQPELLDDLQAGVIEGPDASNNGRTDAAGSSSWAAPESREAS